MNQPPQQSAQTATPKPAYRVVQNAKIKKAQIMLGDFNVAIAEFYANSAHAQKEIGQMFSDNARLLADCERMRKQVEHLWGIYEGSKARCPKCHGFSEQQWCELCDKTGLVDVIALYGELEAARAALRDAGQGEQP